MAKNQEDLAPRAKADPSSLVVRTRKTLQWMPEEADYQKPAESSDISADTGRERECLGTRWDDVLFSKCQPGQIK